jgi:NADH-quinone oxidoreductase subunit M
VIAIIYTSLVALMQEDIKKLIAYSSVAHMGFVTMGIFRRQPAGRAGRDLPDAVHGSSRARCSCVSAWSTTGCTPARSRPMAAWSTTCRSYAVAFMVFTMANVGLPGTSGFVGEFLTLMGVFQVNTWVALFATTGVILSAAMRCGSTAASSSARWRRKA